MFYPSIPNGHATKKPETSTAFAEPTLPPLSEVSVLDPIPTRRNANGGRIPDDIAYRLPAAGLDKSDHCAFDAVIEEIAKTSPIIAAKVRHDFDDKLVPAQKDLEKAVRRAEDQLRKLQTESKVRDAAIEEALAHIKHAKQEALAPFDAALTAEKAKLEASSQKAAATFAQAGAAFDPKNPTDAELLHVPRLSASEEAAASGIPKPAIHEIFTSKLAYFIHYGLISLVGVLVGVSVGIVAGIVIPQRLGEQGAIVAAFAIVGLAIAVLSHKAVVHAFSVAAESSAYGNATAKFLLAFGVVLAMLAADIVVERQGILKIAQTSQILAGQSGGMLPQTPEEVYYILASVITLGFFACAAYEGYLLGTRLAEFANAMMEKRKAQRRAQAEVVAALHDLGEVKCALAKVQDAVDRKQETAALFDEESARQESKRIPYPLEVSTEQKKLIQDAVDQVTGTQFEIDLQIKDFMKPPGFFGRLFQAIKNVLFGHKQKPKVRKNL